MELESLGNLNNNDSSKSGFIKRLKEEWIFLIIAFSFSIIGIFLSKGKKRVFLIGILIMAISAIIGTLYGNPVYPRYRLPFDPLIVIAGIIGFLTLIKKIKQKV